MDQCLRRSFLAGLPALLTACATRQDPADDYNWLLGEWQGAFEGQQLAVTSVDRQNDMALGAWAGEPVYIILTGMKLRFVTASGAQVQLSQLPDATMIGTIDRAPWLRYRPQPTPIVLRQRSTGRVAASVAAGTTRLA